MIDEKKLTKELKRLMKLPFAPQNSEDAEQLMAEYRRIARRDARSLAHFLRAVDHLVDTSSRVPPPAMLANAILETPVPEREKAPMGCEICQGNGWQSFTRMVGKQLLDYADFCVCDLGQFLRNAEIKRKQERSSKGAA